ncbi:uncharacterized protein [Cardiocondyla obscurior]|uniref:uncharacterized protein n=1 Tax=Cardiocondyla obscurior TaxID=286306 RepID=UPI00396585B5
MADRHVTVCAFLDIKGAFDNVIPDILLDDLKEISIPARIRKFIANIPTDRVIYFVVNGNISSPHATHKGTPQGSILSPLLFNIYLRKIGRYLESGTKILQYADDIVIYSTHYSEQSAANSINNSLSRISSFLGNKGLTLSPTKSQHIVFSCRRISAHSMPIPLHIDNSIIPYQNQAKFLGTYWGAHPQLFLIIYRAVLRSSIDFGCQTFNFDKNSNLFLTLQRTQFKAIHISLGYRLLTSINVMLDEAKEPLLHHRFDYIASRYLFRQFSLSDNSVININQVFFTAVSDIVNNAVTFYTDGSKGSSSSSACNVGAVIFSPELKLQIKHKLPSETSIFTAEAWAIYQALIVIIQFNISKSIIFSDSKSVLDALNSKHIIHKNYLILLIRDKIASIIHSSANIKLMWIPAHVDISGNEQADCLAKEASVSGFKPTFHLPFQDLYAESRRAIKLKFDSYLKNTARYKAQASAVKIETSEGSLCLICNFSSDEKMLAPTLHAEDNEEESLEPSV